MPPYGQPPHLRMDTSDIQNVFAGFWREAWASLCAGLLQEEAVLTLFRCCAGFTLMGVQAEPLPLSLTRWRVMLLCQWAASIITHKTGMMYLIQSCLEIASFFTLDLLALGQCRQLLRRPSWEHWPQQMYFLLFRGPWPAHPRSHLSDGTLPIPQGVRFPSIRRGGVWEGRHGSGDSSRALTEVMFGLDTELWKPVFKGHFSEPSLQSDIKNGHLGGASYSLWLTLNRVAAPNLLHLFFLLSSSSLASI